MSSASRACRCKKRGGGGELRAAGVDESKRGSGKIKEEVWREEGRVKKMI